MCVMSCLFGVVKRDLDKCEKGVGCAIGSRATIGKIQSNKFLKFSIIYICSCEKTHSYIEG
jgi:hypothetical protein